MTILGFANFIGQGGMFVQDNVFLKIRQKWNITFQQSRYSALPLPHQFIRVSGPALASIGQEGYFRTVPHTASVVPAAWSPSHGLSHTPTVSPEEALHLKQ